MTWAAVAIGGTALVGGGMATQGYFGNKSSKRAARAANDAYGQMMKSRQAALAYQRPYEAGGRGGFNVLTGLLTGNQYDQGGNVSATLNPEEQQKLFQKSPGYQFRIDQAMKNVQASQAAKGGLLSGGAMKELSDYGSGVASDEYGNYISQLMGLSGMGQQAATNMSNIETGMGSQMAGLTQDAGMAMANRDAQMGNIIGGGLSNAGGLMAMIAGSGKVGSGTTTPSGFSSTGGGQYNSQMMMNQMNQGSKY